MQFKVPQFLDIEDKIFGPFTFSEFVYLAGGAGICFVLYRAIGLLLGIVPMILVAGLAAALVFYKPNNKPFVDMIEAGFKYVLQDKLYIWKRNMVKKPKPNTLNTPRGLGQQTKIEMLHPATNKLTGDKLRDLAWSLDVLDLKREQN